MVVQYSAWCLTSISRENPYPGNFPYPRTFPYPGFLHEFLHSLITGLLYPVNFIYPGKYPCRVVFFTLSKH